MASRPRVPLNPPHIRGSDTASQAGGAASDGHEWTERAARIMPRSQALIYEIQLKEVFDSYSKSPCKERIYSCFRILDDLIPQVGTFSSILGIVRDELHRSVFSSGLTSSNKEPFVERIPFFSLVDRIDDIRAQESLRTNEIVGDLSQKVKFRDHDLQILNKKNLALKQEITDHEAHEHRLKEEITRLEMEIQRHEREKHEIRMNAMRQEDGLKKEIEQCQANLLQSNNIIEKLTMFKEAYNEATDSNKLEEEMNKKRNDLVVDAKGMISYDLHQAKMLERQFSEILDYQLDDFDTTLAQIRKKREIMHGVASNKTGEEPEVVDKETIDLQTSFQKSMIDLLSELKLIKNHVQGLKLAQSKLEENAMMSIDRTADIAMRKYAGVMHTSIDNGVNFKPFTGINNCIKCGAKSVVCPHNGLVLEAIRLPEGTTHVKFVHPLLRIKTTATAPEIEPGMIKKPEDEEEENKETEDEDKNASQNFIAIWTEFYKNRKGVKPALTRIFPIQKLLSFIQEVYDTRWIIEEKYDEMGNIDEAGLTRFIDYFYNLMHDRYKIPEITLKAVHDVFTSLQQYEKVNQNVGLFVLHLSGQEDVLWKYLYMARKLIYSRPDPIDMLRYRQVIQVMYPNRPREVFEQMELEFTAFSKNKVSRESMDDHLVHMMATGIEPNFKFFSICLAKFDFHKKGMLSYEDFDEALSQILPSASTRERRVRFKLTELDLKRGSVPIQRLSHIASYIVIYTCYKSKWAMQSLISPDFAENMQHGNDAAGAAAPAAPNPSVAQENDAVTDDGGDAAAAAVASDVATGDYSK